MGITYLFFSTLAVMIVMLALKDWELHKGRKPFSALRYRLDSSLRKRFLHLFSFFAYFNRHTAKLLLLFVLQYVHRGIVFVVHKVKGSELYTLIRGRYHSFSASLPERNSVFLNSLSTHKRDGAITLHPETDESRA